MKSSSFRINAKNVYFLMATCCFIFSRNSYPILNSYNTILETSTRKHIQKSRLHNPGYSTITNISKVLLPLLYISQLLFNDQIKCRLPMTTVPFKSLWKKKKQQHHQNQPPSANKQPPQTSLRVVLQHCSVILWT